MRAIRVVDELLDRHRDACGGWSAFGSTRVCRPGSTPPMSSRRRWSRRFASCRSTFSSVRCRFIPGSGRSPGRRSCTCTNDICTARNARVFRERDLGAPRVRNCHASNWHIDSPPRWRGRARSCAEKNKPRCAAGYRALIGRIIAKYCCLRYVELLTVSEIAAVLHISPAAVKMRHVRALERLRELTGRMPRRVSRSWPNLREYPSSDSAVDAEPCRNRRAGRRAATGRAVHRRSIR